MKEYPLTDEIRTELLHQVATALDRANHAMKELLNDSAARSLAREQGRDS